MLLEQTITLFATCVAIAFGFNFVDIASRTIMRGMKFFQKLRIVNLICHARVEILRFNMMRLWKVVFVKL